MKKINCVLAVAAFAVCMAACSGSKNSSSTGTTSPNSSMQSSSTPDSALYSGTMRDTTHHR